MNEFAMEELQRKYEDGFVSYGFVSINGYDPDNDPEADSRGMSSKDIDDNWWRKLCRNPRDWDF